MNDSERNYQTADAWSIAGVLHDGGYINFDCPDSTMHRTGVIVKLVERIFDYIKGCNADDFEEYDAYNLATHISDLMKPEYRDIPGLNEIRRELYEYFFDDNYEEENDD